jgi:hypothetical protein
MAKGKVKSSKAGAFLKGGNTKMFGKQGVKPSAPGKISVSSPAGGGKWAAGGGGKMFGYTGSKSAKPR